MAGYSREFGPIFLAHADGSKILVCVFLGSIQQRSPTSSKVAEPNLLLGRGRLLSNHARLYNPPSFAITFLSSDIYVHTNVIYVLPCLAG